MKFKEVLTNVEIKEKYLKAPSNDQIFGFIDELGVSISQFERYYSIPFSVLRHVKRGVRPLPIKLWPIFYERIVPQYGVKYTPETHFETKSDTKKQITGNGLKIKPLGTDTNHDRLTTLK